MGVGLDHAGLAGWSRILQLFISKNVKPIQKLWAQGHRVDHLDLQVNFAIAAHSLSHKYMHTHTFSLC